MSVVDYYSKLVGYWNELDGVAKRYFSNCGKCECKNFGLILSRKPKKRKLINF